MSTMPKDGDLVEAYLTREAAVKNETRYHGTDETCPDHIRGRVYNKKRGYAFCVSLFEARGDWTAVVVGGGDELHEHEFGGKVRILTLEDLTLTERLRVAFEDAQRGYHRVKLFEQRTGHYREGGEGIGWQWSKADEPGVPGWNSQHEGLTLFPQSYYQDEPQLAVRVYREFERGDRHEPDSHDTWLDTFGVDVVKRDYRGEWKAAYDATVLNREGLSAEGAVTYAVSVNNTLVELFGDLEGKAVAHGQKLEEEAITEMLTPFNLAFFKRYGHTTPV